jgi:DNA mismatch repair protein MutL
MLDPGEVDVNVHPRKAEVRFRREKELENTITAAVEKVLSENGLVPEIRKKDSGAIQKTFEISGSSGRLQQSEQVLEAREVFQTSKSEKAAEKTVENAKELSEGSGTPEISNKVLRDKAETYTYPVKDTERKLKKSERLLDFAAGGPQETLKEKEQDEKEKENGAKIEEIITKLGEREKETANTPERQRLKQKPNTESLENLKIIGQVSKMYILAEKGEDLVIIDQHAAHERILYEQVLRVKKSRVQELISPVTIDLTPKEKVLMEEYIPYLEEYGFGISEFGDNTYVVTFVPDVFGRLENPEVVHDVVSDLLASGKVKKETGISEKVCKTLACRAAIKGGAACNLRQMEELIDQLKKAENPYSCPHGRPTVITLTKGELDRMFARIQ